MTMTATNGTLRLGDMTPEYTPVEIAGRVHQVPVFTNGRVIRRLRAQMDDASTTYLQAVEAGIATQALFQDYLDRTLTILLPDLGQAEADTLTEADIVHLLRAIGYLPTPDGAEDSEGTNPPEANAGKPTGATLPPASGATTAPTPSDS